MFGIIKNSRKPELFNKWVKIDYSRLRSFQKITVLI